MKARPEQTYAVVVGIEKYNAGPKWDLDGPAHDARKFVDWLIAKGVYTDNIWLFMSALDENSNLVMQPGPLVQEATQQNLSHTFLDILPERKGDLLYIFWGGHGVITVAADRRLFFCDATQSSKRNLILDSLLSSLRSNYFPGFPQQICIIDTCANYIEDRALPIMGGEQFPGGPPRANCEQFVLLAARSGTTATNVTRRKTGLFSEVVMEELAKETDDQWPPSMAELAVKLDERFSRLRSEGSTRQIPTYLWYRDYGGREGSRGDVNPDTILDLASGKIQVVVGAGGKEYPRPTEHVRFRAPTFVGRQGELKSVVSVLQKARTIGLHALKGMGGIGKTALAAEVAAVMDDKDRFPGGVLWANLAVETPSEIAARWLGNYGYNVSRDAEHARLARLGTVLAAVPALLVLDNVQDATSVRKLLVKAPGVSILITTRKQAAIPAGVHAVPLDQMPPDEALLLLSSLVGNQRIQAELSSAQSICTLCGYLPLALTLAGSQLENNKRWRTLDSYRKRLEQHRLSTLSLGGATEDNVRLAFDASYDELAEAQKSVFDSLCLFFGPEFTQAAVSAIHNQQQIDEDSILDVLVDLSLVLRSDDDTYRLHDLLRDYANEKLKRHNLDEISVWRKRLVLFYRGFTHSNSRNYLALERERQNILGSLDFVRSTGDDEWDRAFVETAHNLASFFKDRGLWKEAIKLGEEAYEIASKLGSLESQADIATATLSWMYYYQGNIEVAKRWAEIGLGLFENIGSEKGRAAAARRLGMTLMSGGQFDAARAYLLDALESFRRTGTLNKVGDTLTALGYLERKQGNLTTSKKYLDESLAILRGISDEKEVSMALYQLGRLASTNGQIDEAQQFHEDSLRIDRVLQRKPGIAWNLLRLGMIELALSIRAGAEEKLRMSMNIFDEMGAAERVHQIYQILETEEARDSTPKEEKMQ